MTPIGHSLFGTSIGVLCMPELETVRARAVFLTGFALLANVPDFAVPGWGHDRYHISHGLFVNSALIAAAAVVLTFWASGRKRFGGTGVILGGAAAWLSHLLLDSFYSHGKGIAIFWPFSRARLALPIPWLDNLQGSPPPLNAHTVRVCLVELVFFSFILSVSAYWRFRLSARLPRSGR